MQPGAQRLAFDEGHDEVRRLAAGAVVDGAGVEDREDVGMLEPRGELDLAEEPRDARRARSSSGRTTLMATRAAVAQVPRQIDRRHPAGADLALEGVAVAEREPSGAGRCRSWRRRIYRVR